MVDKETARAIALKAWANAREGSKKEAIAGEVLKLLQSHLTVEIIVTKLRAHGKDARALVKALEG